MLGNPRFQKLTPREKHSLHVAGLEALYDGTTEFSTYSEVLISKGNRVVQTEKDKPCETTPVLPTWTHLVEVLASFRTFLFSRVQRHCSAL